MLEIPFYENHGYRCAETTVKSVLKYYFPERDYSLIEIASLLNRRDGKLVYMTQLANALINLGLEIDYYSSYGLGKYLREDPKTRMKEIYGENAEKIIKHTDFSALEKCIKRLNKYKGYKRGSLTFSDIKNAFSDSNLIICLLNYDIFVERENNYNGHYVIITNIDEENIWYHEVGPKNAQPNKKIEKRRFINSWNKLCFFDEDTIFVTASRSKS